MLQKYIMHIVITCWIRKSPTNWYWPHGISVVPHLWQPFPRNIIMCAESHDAAACTNILSTRQTRFYQIKWRVTGEKDGKVLTQLTFSSSLPQNFSVVLRISALYLRISALNRHQMILEAYVNNFGKKSFAWRHTLQPIGPSCTVLNYV